MRYTRYIAPSKQRRLARAVAPVQVAAPAQSITQAQLDAERAAADQARQEATDAQARADALQATVRSVKAQAKADAARHENMIQQIRDTVLHLKSPNGSMKKVMSIVALPDSAKPAPASADQTPDMFANAA